MINDLNCVKSIVVKVGTSTLTYENGKLILHRIDKLARVLSDISNSGVKVTLVSSGAIGVGVGKLGLKNKPKLIAEKQAAAAVGQCELMFLYDKMFSQYGCKTAQVLLTKDVVDNEKRRENAENTLNMLLDMSVIPIVNENDAVSVEEIEFGDNDTLSATVATLINADLLILLTDIDGLYDKNPRENKDAKLIHIVNDIDDDIKSCASGTGTNRGTGGMITKIMAAEIAKASNIKTAILNGADPDIIYSFLNGNEIGTLFV